MASRGSNAPFFEIKPFLRDFAFGVTNEICLILEKHKKYSEAIQLCRALVILSPENPLGYYRWGKLLAECKNYQDALQQFLKASSLLNDDQEGPVTKLLVESQISQIKRLDPCTFLPNEMLHIIFSYLSILEWTGLQHVSRRWCTYLANNCNLWNTCSFHIDDYRGTRIAPECVGFTERTLRRFLLNAAPHGNIKFRVITLNLTVFASNEEHLKCLSLLNRTNFQNAFPGLLVDKLIIPHPLPSSYMAKDFENLVPVKFLEIMDNFYFFVKNKVDIELILKSQPTLEVLLSRSLLTNTFNMIQLNSLKALSVYICNADETTVRRAISCITRCRNLEYFEFRQIAKKRFNFDMEKFGKVLYRSKLKALSLEGIRIPNNHNLLETASRDITPTIWPETLISLNSFCIGSWKDYSLSKGTLSKLRRLQMMDCDNIQHLMEHFNIGTNLTHLSIRLRLNKKGLRRLGRQCPNIKFFSLWCGRPNNALATAFVKNYQNLEEIELHKVYFVSMKFLTALTRIKGLKRIGWSGYKIVSYSDKLKFAKLLSLANVSVGPCFTTSGTDYESCKYFGMI